MANFQKLSYHNQSYYSCTFTIILELSLYHLDFYFIYKNNTGPPPTEILNCTNTNHLLHTDFILTPIQFDEL